MERLQKILARAGLASRREVERWIVEGRITVNGAVVRKLGSQADPAKDSIKVDGKRVKPAAAPLYYAFHKPPAIITTLNDPEHRPDLTPFLEGLAHLRKGIRLDDGVTAPARVRVIEKLRKNAWIEIEVHEGRKREVRRMFEALGYFVEKLIRIRFGPIVLGALPPGKLRPL